MTSPDGDIQQCVSAPRDSRPRPLAEVALDVTNGRAEELGRRWIAALVMARPLGTLGDLSLETLALEAPTLCAQVLGALQSDVELDRLAGRGSSSARSSVALRLAGLVSDAGGGGATVVEAVEALRGIVWEALVEEVGLAGVERSAVRRIADLSDRLAHVCACMLATALSESTLKPPRRESRVETEESSTPARAETARVSMAVIVDEHEEQAPAARALAGEEPVLAPTTPPAPERPPSWDESPPVAPSGRARGGAWKDPYDEIEIRDERADAGPAAWIGSIGRELERFARDGRPFAVLLVEPDEIERLRRQPEELASVDASIERALSHTLTPGTDLALAPLEQRPSLMRQSPGRYWVLAQVDRARAEQLAERLGQAPAAARADAGRALELSVGVAVCPEDGRDAPALAAHADVSLYAARSASRLKRGRDAQTSPVERPS
jgi:GGDEF domain-containing protein